MGDDGRVDRADDRVQVGTGVIDITGSGQCRGTLGVVIDQGDDASVGEATFGVDQPHQVIDVGRVEPDHGEAHHPVTIAVVAGQSPRLARTAQATGSDG